MKVAKTAKQEPEVRLKLGSKTLDRKAALYVEGDFQRIVEEAAKKGIRTDRKNVWNAFSVGNAPKSLAKVIQQFYAEKERDQKLIDA